MSHERLFVACEVPQVVRVWVTDRVERGLFEGARWLPIENQHITLKFLGSTPSEDVAKVAAACASVAGGNSSSSVRVTDLGVFPNARRAAVLWVGVRDERALLFRLARDLDDALEPLGWTPEERSFTPHITLARLRPPRRVGELPDLPSGAPRFEVNSLTLYRSRLHPSGSRYEVIERFQLS